MAIVASATLATMLARKANGRIDGFVVEGPTAGGHNAPPRAPAELNARGQPLYGERDKPDLAAFRALGLPFWLAGSYGRPGRLAEALEAGAAGVQVGTAFAYCEESGLRADIKRRVLESSRAGSLDVFTDPLASPTGYPFKVVQLSGTLSDKDVYDGRMRMCDLGYLRRAYRRPNGSLGWRCPAERSDIFMARGGDPAECQERKCLCNALLANVGLGQIRPDGSEELPLITSGDDVCQVAEFLPHPHAVTYSARDVVERLIRDLAELRPDTAAPWRVPITHNV